MRTRLRTYSSRLLCGAAVFALATGAAHAEPKASFSIPPQPLATALAQFGVQSGHTILVGSDLTAAKSTRGFSSAAEPDAALHRLLDGTGLSFRRDGDVFVIVRVSAQTPRPLRLTSAEIGASDAGEAVTAGAAPDANIVQELVVTAQKREEAIQTVPIAISAFTQKTLEEQHIEGGFDLLKAIPNVTFSKNNFTGYNFSIRGIGTKAISATTDPGVAVAFNNTALLQNRLFEQEYFDVERVEVLRGPQGTLYGRNATAGVINVISAKPSDHFEGSIKAEVGNYQSRRATGMINVPIFGDKLAVRFAGSFTERDGYDYNSVTHNSVNGRNLWSGRLTVGFKPFERLHGNFIWEHFDENDNRSRTGKQLCHRDNGPDMIGSTPIYVPDEGGYNKYRDVLRHALFSQGCKPGSLYDDDAFGTPNGLALPFVFGMLANTGLYTLGYTGNTPVALVKLADPYGGMMQSRDLHTIASFRDPKYRAKADVFELNFDFDITDALTFTSQTAYNKDQVYSFQDFNRFNTVPVFTDTASLTLHGQTDSNPSGDGPSPWAALAPGGVFCDPQLGCSNTLAGFDISQANARQFSQEIRLQSSFSGPVNFSVGGNYTRFKTLVDYYVMYNLISAYAMFAPFNRTTDFTKGCNVGDRLGEYDPNTGRTSDVFVGFDDPQSTCPYIDPNPVESINGNGHNYFRSKNPYKLSSVAAFGEVYWNLAPALKITAGLRYTDDRKTFTPVPSQVLLARGLLAGGEVNSGYPEKPDIKQKWGEFTGRLGVDWKPELSFTDATMLYAFYSRGYKGGGANPPSPGFASEEESIDQMRTIYGFSDAIINIYKQLHLFPILSLTGVEYGKTFDPEFVNAFEIGAKNTLMGGRLVLNADAFLYDYKGYQVSQIRDRTAVNENFDAKTWGAELEAVFSPSRNLRINGNIGYLDTRIANGETSIDIMNRTQGNPNYTLVKPWVQLPSNCVVPTPVAERFLQVQLGLQSYWEQCGIGGILHGVSLSQLAIDPATGLPYNSANYPELNGGAGLKAQLGGNELPNAPHWTMSIGAQYAVDFLESWRATLRGDAYWQSQSWARVYNDDPYDKLHGWYNVNLSLWVEKPDIGLKIEIYAKNLLDKTPITDAFLNSDDTALTTNVFVLDPRLIGFSVTKKF